MGSSSIDFDTPPALDFERLRDWRGRLVDHLRARWPYWVLGAIVLLTALVYGRTIGYEHLHAFDDNLYVLNRPEVRDWWGATWWQRVLTPKTGYSVAVPTFVYAHVRMVFPDQFPHVLHGVNLAVHLLNVVLVFVLAKRWTDENVAVLAAAIWGLHPMQVESVAWLTNLKVVLFGTGSLLWLLGCESYVDRARDQRSVWPIAAAWLQASNFSGRPSCTRRTISRRSPAFEHPFRECSWLQRPSRRPSRSRTGTCGISVRDGWSRSSARRRTPRSSPFLD